MADHVPYLTRDSFHETLASTDPVLVDFTASWCPPCKLMAPILDELADEQRGRIAVAKVDVDAEPELAARYDIRSMPTMIVFENGEPVHRLVGARPKRQLMEELADWLSRDCAGC